MKKVKTPKEDKRTLKDVSLGARIMISGIVTIIIPILILGISMPFFFTASASYFNLSSVTTNSFSALNQIQWDYTLNQMSKKLVSSEGKKSTVDCIDEIGKYIKPIENLGSYLKIQVDDSIEYQTDKSVDIDLLAKNITNFKDGDNIMYMGSNGLVIVDHIVTESKTYTITIVNDSYKMADSTALVSTSDILKYLTGKTGLILLIVAGIFVLSALGVSIITSNTINKPLKELKNGVNELAAGNFEYEIAYSSKNEVGEIADAFNNMKARLIEAMENQQKLEHSKQVMIAGVTHDLRTPLTSIKGYVEGLIDGIASTPKKREQYLNIIHNSACDMERLLNDLLTFSMLDLGTIELEKENLSIKDFVEDFVLEEQNIYQNDDSVSIEYICNCEGNPKVNIDSPRFSRVVENIVSNSIKYKKKLENCKIQIKLSETKSAVLIEFEDNGVGVDAEHLSKIFDTFYRVDPARSKVKNGSGLGLSICKQIVELHDGSIWATGEIGVGLNIHIYLPKTMEVSSEKNINN